MDDEIMPPAEEPKRCVMCERMTGVFGILLGTVILLIAIDILSNGGISNLISGGAKDGNES
jgi:hypothetical protein